MTQNLTNRPEVSEVKFEGHHPSIVTNAISNLLTKKMVVLEKHQKFPNFLSEWAVEHIAQGNIPMEQGKHFVSSLEKMLCGGIRSRRGIHRYSVDENG